MIKLDDLGKTSGGGSSFFKLEDGQSKRVRFLFNTVSDVENNAYYVHVFSGKNFATIACSRGEGEAIDTCKWCSMGNNKVDRVVIPFFLEEENEIQYWTRSGKWVSDTLIPVFTNLPEGAPISGQSFIISRKGKTMQDTVYTIAPDMRVQNDMKTKEQFGDIKDAFECGAIKPNDYDFDPKGNESNSNNQQIPQATRRTTDVF